jgi:two-component system cell cycle response regulator DivK
LRPQHSRATTNACEPLVQPDEEPPRAAPKPILIVEDNELNLKLLNDILEFQGYEIVATGLGGAALELARQHQPGLILLDMQLPDISGLDVAQQLKGDEHTRMIPIIGVTAFAMPGDQRKVLDSGCDFYVAKPLKIIELLELVKRIIGGNPR